LQQQQQQQQQHQYFIISALVHTTQFRAKKMHSQRKSYDQLARPHVIHPYGGGCTSLEDAQPT
jgi:hypothetical protein